MCLVFQNKYILRAIWYPSFLTSKKEFEQNLAFKSCCKIFMNTTFCLANILLNAIFLDQRNIIIINSDRFLFQSFYHWLSYLSSQAGGRIDLKIIKWRGWNWVTHKLMKWNLGFFGAELELFFCQQFACMEHITN